MRSRAELEMAPFAVTLIAFSLATMNNAVDAGHVHNSIPPRSAFLLCWSGRCGYPPWDETTKRAPYYSFGLGKRHERTGFLDENQFTSQHEDEIEQHIPQDDLMRILSKRSEFAQKVTRHAPYQRFALDLGKRKREIMSVPQELNDISEVDSEDDRQQGYLLDLAKRDSAFGPGSYKDKMYGFGLGKRKNQMYEFGLGKRDKMYEYGLGKRDKMYGFGLGKRFDQMNESGLRQRDKMYGFGLGKKDKMYGFGLGKRQTINIVPSRKEVTSVQGDTGNSLLTHNSLV